MAIEATKLKHLTEVYSSEKGTVRRATIISPFIFSNLKAGILYEGDSTIRALDNQTLYYLHEDKKVALLHCKEILKSGRGVS